MFADPEQNLRQFELGESMIVADLGAGSGFYAISAAKMVPKGKVYAIEIMPDFVTSVRNKAREAHVSNLECLIGDIEELGGTKLGDHIIDRVIASNVLFQVENRERFVEEIKRILKDDGKVMLIDWSSGGVLGPREKFLVTRDAARELFERKGFILEQEIDAGEYHYGMIFKKK